MKIVLRLYTSSILVAFIIAFVIAVAGNLTWQWLSSHLWNITDIDDFKYVPIDDVGKFLMLGMPIYAAIKMLRIRGFLIGLLCVITFICGKIAADAIFISYMDSCIRRNMNHRREIFEEDYAYFLIEEKVEKEGWAFENDDQRLVFLEKMLPKAREILPSLPQSKIDDFNAILLAQFRQMPLKEQIFSFNDDIGNKIFIILGVFGAFWLGFKGSKESRML